MLTLFGECDLLPRRRAARTPRHAPAENPNFPTLFGRQVPAHTRYGYFTWDGPSKSWEPHTTAAGDALVLAHYAAYPMPVLVLAKAAPPVFGALGRSGPVGGSDHDIHGDVFFAVYRAAVAFDAARGAKFSSYVTWHVRKAADQHLRQRRAERASRSAAVTPDAADPDAGRDLERCLAALDAATVLARLPAGDARLVCTLSGLGRRRRTLAEVGRSLGVSKTAVANRVKRIAEAFAGRD